MKLDLKGSLTNGRVVIKITSKLSPDCKVVVKQGKRTKVRVSNGKDKQVKKKTLSHGKVERVGNCIVKLGNENEALVVVPHNKRRRK